MKYESAEPKFQSAVLTTDAEKNLLWLSLVDGQSSFKDPNFTTLVRRTTQFVVSTGEIDLINGYPNTSKVSDFLLRPPAAAVKAIVSMRFIRDLPLYTAYGDTWLATIEARARTWREPHDINLDSPITDYSLGQAVIANYK